MTCSVEDVSPSVVAEQTDSEAKTSAAATMGFTRKFQSRDLLAVGQNDAE